MLFFWISTVLLLIEWANASVTHSSIQWPGHLLQTFEQTDWMNDSINIVTHGHLWHLFLYLEYQFISSSYYISIFIKNNIIYAKLSQIYFFLKLPFLKCLFNYFLIQNNNDFDLLRGNFSAKIDLRLINWITRHIM